MFHYRQVLVRSGEGDSDRQIARSKTMGRRKLAHVREVAGERGGLAPAVPLPDDAVLAAAFERPQQALPASCVSSLEPWRERITQWHGQGIQGTPIHAALAREYGYPGSLSSVYRFMSQRVMASPPEVPLACASSPVRRPKWVSVPGRSSPMR
jgi:hypothetical protein